MPGHSSETTYFYIIFNGDLNPEKRIAPSPSSIGDQEVQVNSWKYVIKYIMNLLHICFGALHLHHELRKVSRLLEHRSENPYSFGDRKMICAKNVFYTLPD